MEFRNKGTVLAAYEGLGECDAGAYQNCKCATTGRGAGGCVDFSISEGSSDTLHVQVWEETAKLSHVRQLLHDHLRAGKAWKAPRTEEVAEANSPNLVPMDVGPLHRKGGKGEEGQG